MQYQDFISAVAQNQTDRVKALNIPASSSPDSIPKNFNQLIPDVIQIIDKHFDRLSDGRLYIGVFGLQAVGFTIKSHFPLDTHRITSPKYMTNHLCGVLYFLPVNSIDSAIDWKHYKSMVIDFTKGSVIDQARYLHTVVHSQGTGKIYGKISAQKLAHVWQEYKAATGF